MQNRELNTCKHDIYSFLRFSFTYKYRTYRGSGIFRIRPFRLLCGSSLGLLGRCGRIGRSRLHVGSDVDQLDLELQSLVGTDVTACAARTVSQVGGNPERDLAALAHQLQTLPSIRESHG